MVKKARSPRVDEDRDPNNISTKNHMQIFAETIKAGEQGIHNPPGERRKKGGGRK